MKRFPLFLSLLFVITCAKEDSQNPNTPPSNITKQYTLTVSAGEGGSVSTAGGTFSGGTQVSITATPSEGYRFSGWSNGSIDNPFSVTLSSNTSVTANFQLIVNSYTLYIEIGIHMQFIITLDTDNSLIDNLNTIESTLRAQSILSDTDSLVAMTRMFLSL